MQERIRGHIRSNVVGYVALFLTLSLGTAYADHGFPNSISSEDIIDAEVKNQDVAPNAIGTGKIADGQVRTADVLDNNLTAADLANGAVQTQEIATGAVQSDDVANDTTDFGLTAQDLEAGSVGTSEVAPDSLTGNDIDESTLNPDAIAESEGGSCDPNSSTLIKCASVTLLPLNANGISGLCCDEVLVMASGEWFGTKGFGAEDKGACNLRQTGFSPVFEGAQLGQSGDQHNSSEREASFAFMAVRHTVSGASAEFFVECNERGGDMHFGVTVSAVRLGSSPGI